MFLVENVVTFDKATYEALLPPSPAKSLVGSLDDESMCQLTHNYDQPQHIR